MDSEPEVRQTVPKHYHDFLDVFSKQGTDALPLHWLYDCPIKLLPGAEIPFGRIYPLTEREQEVLKDYIQENLKKGFHPTFYLPSRCGHLLC